jgi:alkanesulfonate monooxygenase SsuD/methylene tetrahydromethanopterin reductase-like flavin-dependent oxidoreductase (luciferase family)
MFQGRADMPDEAMYREEMAMALEAESLGFDRLMAVEHHFTDYAMCPDNAQVMAYLAGQTSTIELFPSAFILPWNDPLRVAEKIVLLDHLSNGRAVLGLGRGLARNEFDGFRVEMSESRARFDEAAAMILDAVETGTIEGAGPHYEQPKVEIRPRPLKTFKGRSYMVGTSPASVEAAARLGLACMKFGAHADALPEVELYRGRFEEHWARPAPPVLTADMLVCCDDRHRAEALAREHEIAYWYSVMNHYELLGAHFEQTAGSYDHYANTARALAGKVDVAAERYMQANLWGDPDQILEQLRVKREIFGAFDLAVSVSFAGIPYEDARRSLRLFASDVLPELQEWTAEATVSASE